MANEFLEDEDVQKLAQTYSTMPPLLRAYRIKKVVSLWRAVRPLQPTAERVATLPAFARILIQRSGASTAVMDEWLSQLRFGMLSSVSIDANTSEQAHLGEWLQQLPLSVRSVRVRRETFDRDPYDGWDSCVEELPPPSSVHRNESFLRHVVLHLPAHIRSLIFEQYGMGIFFEDKYTEDLLPPIAKWTLPAGLTELHLPRCLQLDKAGHGAAVELPPQLVELHLGYGLSNHSLAKLKLPASLRVLHLGAWLHEASADWPSLPDSLEELQLSGRFNQPLSSLRLPASLRKLHFRSYHGRSNQKASRLFDDPTPTMFPPHLLSLKLPPPITARQESEQEAQLQKEEEESEEEESEDGVVAVFDTQSAPLNLSLLPPSLRFLRIHRAQALMCEPSSDPESSSLPSLRLEELGVFHRDSSWEEFETTKTFSGGENCRKQLQRQLDSTRTARQSRAELEEAAMSAAASDDSRPGSGTGSTTAVAAAVASPSTPAATASAAAAASAPIAGSSASVVSSDLSFTMGTRKRG
jgi:hypothetical protein